MTGNKKRAVFVTDKLIMGGVEKSLLEWVKILSPYLDITVAVMHPGGELESEIAKYASVYVLSNDQLSYRQIIGHKLKTGKIFDVFGMIIAAICGRGKQSYIKQCVNRVYEIDALKERFDYAVCFHKPTDVLVPYTAKRINAKYRFIWFHTELLETVEVDKEYYTKLYQLFDGFVCVSEAVHAQLESILSCRKGDIYTIYNYFDIKEVYERSETIPEEFKSPGTKIVTVGRLSKEKGQDIAIRAARILKDNNTDFRWYFIGDGPYYSELVAMANKLGVQKQIIFLGQKDNPYPYIRYCDIYVQPSREEGYGMTVAEAKLFQRPIVVTDFLTATEHIINGENGYIVSMNERQLGDKILRLMEEKGIRERFTRELKGFAYPVECKDRIFELFGIRN